MPLNLQDYRNLFSTAEIKPGKIVELDAIINKMLQNQGKYQTVADRLGNKIPWWVIAVIHSMECSLNFTRHLHNGDPLTHRTVHVPADRPLKGNPPFTWEQSAEDALRLKHFELVTDWSLENILYLLEKYNGMGYRNPKVNINTPYLWSYTNHYSKGKYVSDGHYDPKAVSGQPGAASILKRMQQRKIIA